MNRHHNDKSIALGNLTSVQIADGSYLIIEFKTVIEVARCRKEAKAILLRRFLKDIDRSNRNQIF